MCYYVSSKLSGIEIKKLENDFAMKLEEEEREDYFAVSGFSHPNLPVLTSEGKFKKYRWGLIPSWVKDWDTAKKLSIQTLNAIGSTLDEKPSFRGSIKAGRFCVVPINGFYEWHHHPNKEKYPHFIYPKDKSLFLLAGIYEQWTNKPANEVFDTFTVVTTEANGRMEWIHNSKKRMPTILTTEEAKMWLDNGISFNEKKKLIHPFDESLMVDHTISKLITSRKENPNTDAVMQPFEYPELIGS